MPTIQRPSARGAVHYETRHITEGELEAEFTRRGTDVDAIDAACRAIANDLGVKPWEVDFCLGPWVGGGLVVRGRLRT